MVQLQVFKDLFDNYHKNGFNPKMVQLQELKHWDSASQTVVSIPKWYNYKPAFLSYFIKFYCVSIPKWYNYKYENIYVLSSPCKFQSQNGTITSSNFAFSGQTTGSFQSQNGTITRVNSILQNSKLPMFQSQNGTITSFIFVLLCPVPYCFNPKMVQLQEKLIAEIPAFLYVSIPKWYNYKKNTKVKPVFFAGFQSQNGTITSKKK